MQRNKRPSVSASQNANSFSLKLPLIAAALLFGQIANAQPIVFAGETLTPLQNNRFSSNRFGHLSLSSATAEQVTVWSHAASVFLQHRADGTFFSWELGDFKIGPNNRWLETSRFGWTYIGINEQTYNGWIFTERFGWVRVARPANFVYFWVPRINSWIEFRADGSIFSFEWGTLTPLEGDRYHSSRFGEITIGDFGGWVNSLWFGWLWAPGGGQWVWANDRNEWLGVLSNTEVWSTAENRSFQIPPPVPPLEERIGPRGPGGGFLWKPVSEANRNLVVLLPASLTDGFRETFLADADGNIIERGVFSGVHNGGREHYRFSRPGAAYGRDLFVLGQDRNGNRVHWPISNGGSRIEF